MKNRVVKDRDAGGYGRWVVVSCLVMSVIGPCVVPAAVPGSSGLLSPSAAVASQGAAAGCLNPPAGVVAWWTGDGTTNDVQGMYPGTFINTVTFAPGEVGSAFSLDGVGAIATDLDVQPSALPETTWEAWVYPTRVPHSSRQQILSDDDGGYDRSMLIEANTSKFAVFTGTRSWQTADVSTNEWQHIAVVFTPANIVFYKNGVPLSLGSAPAGQSTSHKLQIGRNPGYGEYFQGLIDEVTIYDRALTAGEIQAIYDAGTAGKCHAASGSADLSITATGSPDPIHLGQTLHYSLTVSNQGPDTADNVVVTDLLPAAVTFVSANSAAGPCPETGGKVTCQVAQLAPGETILIEIQVTPNGAGELVNQTTVTGFQDDPNASNNTATISTGVRSTPLTPEDGDWLAESLVLQNTPEADLMVRVGDIDNLGFGWPPGFSPFSGSSSPSHGWPWTANTNDPPGTDRILVGSGYTGSPPAGQDGYAGSAQRPDSLPQPITLSYDTSGLTIHSAILQLFVDDFQASVWRASYQVLWNGTRAPFLETVINSLVQTGPVGKLITLQVPDEFLPQIRSGQLALLIDDPTTGAGDGYALDFVKLLINPQALAQSGTVSGRVTDTATTKPIPAAVISAGGVAGTISDADGNYALTNAPAGLVVVQASHPDYAAQTKAVDLVAGGKISVDFALTFQVRLSAQLTGNSTTLSWSTNAPDYSLLSTPSLSPPIQWTGVTNDVAVVNGRNIVILDTSAGTRFFQLRSL